MRPLPRPAQRLWLAALVLLCPGLALAWSHNEHSAIALVALDLLQQRKSEALKAVSDILGSGATLDSIAPCADDIRHPPKGADPNNLPPVNCGGLRIPYMPQSGGWHFIDEPISESPQNPAAMEAHCPGGNCVTDAVRAQVKALQDGTGDKTVALMFLVHFVGDAHQPLHCATELVLDPAGRPQPDPKRLGKLLNDGGGNGKPVVIPGVQTKFPLELHSLWDHDLEATDSAVPRDLADALEADLKGQDTSAWTSGDFIAQAAFDSFSFAKSDIYPAYYKNLDKTDGKTQIITDQYRQGMKDVAKLRLEKAAVRLAALLEQALAPKTGSAPAQAQSSPESGSALRVPIVSPNW